MRVPQDVVNDTPRALSAHWGVLAVARCGGRCAFASAPLRSGVAAGASARVTLPLPADLRPGATGFLCIRRLVLHLTQRISRRRCPDRQRVVCVRRAWRRLGARRVPRRRSGARRAAHGDAGSSGRRGGCAAAGAAAARAARLRVRAGRARTHRRHRVRCAIARWRGCARRCVAARWSHAARQCRPQRHSRAGHRHAACAARLARRRSTAAGVWLCFLCG